MKSMEDRINLEIVRDWLERRGVPKSYYRIGSFGEEALCILFENGQWVVFEGEHGTRYNVHSFEQESDACIYFLERIKVFL